MITWSLAELLDDRGWSAYKLAQKAGITIPVAYKLAAKGYEPSRIDMETLDKVCNALNVAPSKFISWKRG